MGDEHSHINIGAGEPASGGGAAPAAAAAVAAGEAGAYAALGPGFGQDPALRHVFEQLAESNKQSKLIAEQQKQAMRLQVGGMKTIEEAEAKRVADAKEAADKTQRQLMREAAEEGARGLKSQTTKEAAMMVMAIANQQEPSERAMLAKCYVQMQRALEEDAEDLDACNSMLKAAVKKCKSLSTDEQEELVDKLKVKKRKASKTCTRCGGTSHTADGCYAGKHADGSSLEARPRLSQRGPFQGPAMAPFSQQQFGQPQFAPQQNFGQPQQFQQPPMFGLGGPGGPPAQHIQQQQQYQSGPPRGPPGCWECGQVGHNRFNCPATAEQKAAHQRLLPQNQPRGPPGMQVSQQRAASSRGQAAASGALTHSQWHPAVASANTDAQATESLADIYSSSEVWSEKSHQPEASTEPASMYAAKLSSATHHSPSSSTMAEQHSNNNQLEESVTLEYTRGTAEQMHKLAEEGAAWDAGLPEGMQALRGAIRDTFASRQKVLSDAEALAQNCTRCKKLGHTHESCPDQVQHESDDRTPADKWVRRLINLPTLDVAEMNRGLPVGECVKQWLQRGEELNRGNPWAHSTRREDSVRKRLGYHKAMGMSSVHIGWIGFGVPMYFVNNQLPKALAFRNHRSAEEEAEFVDKEHAASVAEGSYVEVPRSQLRGVCPLQVVKHPVSGKLRLCQDLRWINGHLPNVKFRMESLHKELGDVVKPGDKLLTTDIAKAYYCLAMHPKAQRYLGWMWRGKFYMPTCLVFGLAPAPRIFTKLMRPMMAFMRSAGVRVLGMIDDYMWAERPEGIEAVKAAVLQVLPGLGWSLNAKCELTPHDEVLMLGMLINTKEWVVRAPKKKVQATLKDIASMQKNFGEQRPIDIEEVQRVAGRLMSMMLAFGGVRVFTRSLYRVIAAALEGNEIRKVQGARLWYKVQLTREAVDELEFWSKRLLTHNGLEISSRENQVQMVLWCDASDMGYGGEVAGTGLTPAQLGPIEQMAAGLLPRSAIQYSSTHRELVGLRLVAASKEVLDQIRGKRVQVVMDSLPALRNLIKGGGSKLDLCNLVREWWLFCEIHNIRPAYEWVERAKNWRADEASKLLTQGHELRHKETDEQQLRNWLMQDPSTAWLQNQHRWQGKVAVFTPMFHLVDARVEMIRSQLNDAIIVVPKWAAGGTHDWYRRVREHSVASRCIGKASEWYKPPRPQTGHDDQLEAFWLMGRRGERKKLELGSTAHSR